MSSEPQETTHNRFLMELDVKTIPMIYFPGLDTVQDTNVRRMYCPNTIYIETDPIPKP